MVITKVANGHRVKGTGVRRNSAAEISLTTKMLQYSAMKIRANFPPPYSTLNPDTSSDSPSAKSNGARLVSARRVTNQAINSGGNKINLEVECLTMGVARFSERRITRLLIRSRAIAISYEIVWAILRVVPSRAYFLFEDHPAISVG